jgi:hypothetical protein
LFWRLKVHGLLAANIQSHEFSIRRAAMTPIDKLWMMAKIMLRRKR